MKNRLRKILTILIIPIAIVCFFASCLEDKGYTDIIDGANSDKIVLSFYGNTGTTGTQSVVLTPGKDTVDYELHLSATSSHPIGKDITVSVSIDESVLSQVNATIENADAKFTILPDSVYDILSNSVTVPKDTTEASLFIRIYQKKLDITKSYLLPVKINDGEGVVVASNLGTAKLAFIGNPIAGAYLWDFYRYNNQDGSGDPFATWTNEPTVLAAVNPTSVHVPTGYYVKPNYLITFDNNNGVLSNFKAVIDPDEIKAAFTDNGVTVVDGPTITVSEDYKTFTIKYTVFNGEAYRNLTDIYHK